jgi:hypothetical protein
MKPTLTVAAVVGAFALIAPAGCGDKAATSSSSSASSSKATSSESAAASPSASATEQDYSRLLIEASDIVSPGDEFTAQAPTLSPNGTPGVATVFSNSGDTREIGDTILVLPDEGGAATALEGAVASLGSAVQGGTPEPAQVGSSATMVSGTSSDGSKAVTVIVFTEGKAFVTLEFDSAAGDVVPPESVLEIANKQDEKIKANLGG